MNGREMMTSIILDGKFNYNDTSQLVNLDRDLPNIKGEIRASENLLENIEIGSRNQ